MPFRKVDVKPEGSGRIKGVPNKGTIPLEQKCQEMGIAPFELLLLFAGGRWKELGYAAESLVTGEADGSRKLSYTIPPELRLKACMEACQYILAKRKALEISTENNGFEVRILDYTSEKGTPAISSYDCGAKVIS